MSRGSSVWKKFPSRVCYRLQPLLSPMPLTGDDVGDWKSFFRVFNRGSKISVHRQLPIPPMQFVPARNRTGHGDGVHAERRDLRKAPALKKLHRSLRTSPTATVQ